MIEKLICYKDVKKNSYIRSNTAKGERNGSSKLTEDNVYIICNLLSENKLKLTEIAKIFNTAKSTISNIKRRKKWKHVSISFNWDLNPINNKEKQINQKNKILSYFNSNYSPKDLVIMGFPPTTVRRYYENYLQLK